MKVTKAYRQNLLDFVIEQYGDLNSLGAFLTDNKLNGVEGFVLTDTFQVNASPNDNLQVFSATNTKVITGTSIVGADFNDDFNEDFLI